MQDWIERRDAYVPSTPLLSAVLWTCIYHQHKRQLLSIVVFVCFICAGTIVENVSCSIINLNCICICFWCSSNGHYRGLFCGQLMQLGPCMGYKSGHHSLQSMLFWSTRFLHEFHKLVFQIQEVRAVWEGNFFGHDPHVSFAGNNRISTLFCTHDMGDRKVRALLCAWLHTSAQPVCSTILALIFLGKTVYLDR